MTHTDGSQNGTIEADEVLPPEAKPPDSPQVQPGLLRRLESAFGPILAGMLIDLVDLATFGPIGIATGMLLGGGVAWWLCAIYGIPARQRWLWSLLAGAYCTIPMTEPFPIATLIGAYIRFKRPPASKEEKPVCADDTP